MNKLWIVLLGVFFVTTFVIREYFWHQRLEGLRLEVSQKMDVLEEEISRYQKLNGGFPSFQVSDDFFYCIKGGKPHSFFQFVDEKNIVFWSQTDMSKVREGSVTGEKKVNTTYQIFGDFIYVKGDKKEEMSSLVWKVTNLGYGGVITEFKDVINGNVFLICGRK